jgi:hypothetical protein
MKIWSDAWLVRQARKLGLNISSFVISNPNKPREIKCNSCFFQSVCKLDYADECIAYRKSGGI